MRTMRIRRDALGFTIVELLVVIGIIGILVSLLIPAVSTVRNSARELKTQSLFTAIAAGLETYRNATGGPYPPSHSDNEDNPLWIVSPYSRSSGSTTPIDVAVTGANMLAYALAGADLLGTPGFKDVNRDGFWWDDTDDIQDCISSYHGLYSLEDGQCSGNLPTYEPFHRRFGPFLDINKTDITNMRDYAEEVLLPKDNYTQSVPVPTVNLSSDPDDYEKQPFILDGFGYPILYYKANVGASGMMTDWQGGSAVSTGIYDPIDNALYVGMFVESLDFAPNGGMDLGAGKNHPLRDARAPSVNPTIDNWSDQGWHGTFANSIWDRKVTARNVPVKKDSYLLISPGEDALWGTDDDLTNFNQ